jgi:hypothetical protein
LGVVSFGLRSLYIRGKSPKYLLDRRLVGRAKAQAVSRWLPTAGARVRARVRICGICGGQSGTGACVLRVLRFSLPIFIPPIAPQSPSSIIWGWHNRPIVAAVPQRTTKNNNRRLVRSQRNLFPLPLVIAMQWD